MEAEFPTRDSFPGRQKSVRHEGNSRGVEVGQLRDQRPLHRPPSPALPESHAMARPRAGDSAGASDPPSRKRRRRARPPPSYAEDDEVADGADGADHSSSSPSDAEVPTFSTDGLLQPANTGEADQPPANVHLTRAEPVGASPSHLRPPSLGSINVTEIPPAVPDPSLHDAGSLPAEAPIAPQPAHATSGGADPAHAPEVACPPGCAPGCTAGCTHTGNLDVELRAKIRAITRNKNLSAAERYRARQQLYMGRYERTQTSFITAFRAGLRARQFEPTMSNHSHPTTGARLHGCEHYARKCKIRAPCCGVWVGCRHCHDTPEMTADHTLDRFAVREVLCMLCGLAQPVAQSCANPACGTRFARYFCGRCNFYDDDPEKDIYHCDECDICRLGKREDFFHCDICNACVQAGAGSNEHRCLAGALDGDCPVCTGDLRTSTTPVVFVQCGHAMHLTCFDQYTQHRYVCPLCSKALTDLRPVFDEIEREVAAQPVPKEFEGRRLEVVCNDCDRRSVTPFHFMHYKCQLCAGYNTRVVTERPHGEAVSVLPVPAGRGVTAAGAGAGEGGPSSRHGDG